DRAGAAVGGVDDPLADAQPLVQDVVRRADRQDAGPRGDAGDVEAVVGGRAQDAGYIGAVGVGRVRGRVVVAPIEVPAAPVVDEPVVVVVPSVRRPVPAVAVAARLPPVDRPAAGQVGMAQLDADVHVGDRH